jgi:glucokinase
VSRTILAADIGATNSRFAHFHQIPQSELSMVEVQWLPTANSGSFAELIEQLNGLGFSRAQDEADIFVAAVAGPVEHGLICSPPFISWDIDISQIQEEFGFKRVALINDFVAQAYACRSPVGKTEIISGEIVDDATIAVLGAGTALGKAVLIPDGAGGFLAVPSEGGHASFSFISEREYEFQEFLKNELGEDYIIANYVVSGKGLRYIHRFLTGEDLEAKDVAETFALDSETLEWVARFYGRVCRDFALETLSLGGMYIAGGVAAKSPQIITHEAFEKEFRTSSTMGHLLEKIPVFLIDNQDSGLWGAAFLGLQELDRENGS